MIRRISQPPCHHILVTPSIATPWTRHLLTVSTSSSSTSLAPNTRLSTYHVRSPWALRVPLSSARGQLRKQQIYTNSRRMSTSSTATNASDNGTGMTAQLLTKQFNNEVLTYYHRAL
jgi:hypothetical protein